MYSSELPDSKIWRRAELTTSHRSRFARTRCSLAQISLFSVVGNLRRRAEKTKRIRVLRPIGPGGDQGCPADSLHFPCRTGIPAQRRVRDRLAAPPSSPRVRRFLGRSESHRQVSHDSAGFWASGLAGGTGDPGWDAADRITTVDYLCCRLQRFGREPRE